MKTKNSFLDHHFYLALIKSLSLVFVYVLGLFMLHFVLGVFYATIYIAFFVGLITFLVVNKTYFKLCR